MQGWPIGLVDARIVLGIDIFDTERTNAVELDDGLFLGPGEMRHADGDAHEVARRQDRRPAAVVRPVLKDARPIRLVAIGDLAPCDKNIRPKAGEALASLFKTADIIVGNCETTVCDLPENRRTPPLLFNTRPGRFQQALTDLGIEPGRLVLSLANNHAHDLGTDGLTKTAGTLAQLGATVVGLLDGPTDRNATSITVQDHEIVFTAWTQLVNKPLEGSGPAAARHPPSFPKFLGAGDRAPFHIALPHWGTEFDFFPERHDVDLARALLDRGLVAVIGHHPHVLQCLELHSSGLSAFSLGTFGFPGLNWATTVFPTLEIDLARDPEARPTIGTYALRFWTLIEGRGEARIEPIDQGPERLIARWGRIAPLLYPLEPCAAKSDLC